SATRSSRRDAEGEEALYRVRVGRQHPPDDDVVTGGELLGEREFDLRSRAGARREGSRNQRVGGRGRVEPALDLRRGEAGEALLRVLFSEVDLGVKTVHGEHGE